MLSVERRETAEQQAAQDSGCEEKADPQSDLGQMADPRARPDHDEDNRLRQAAEQRGAQERQNADIQHSREQAQHHAAAHRKQAQGQDGGERIGGDEAVETRQPSTQQPAADPVASHQASPKQIRDTRKHRGDGGQQRPDHRPVGEAARETQARIKALGLPGADTVCVRHFGGQYFSYAQAAELDAIADLARDSGSSVLLAATLSTASFLVNSIGKQFAQPIRPRDKSGAPKRHVVKKIIAERGLSARSVFMGYLRQYGGLMVTRRNHVAVRADFQQALAQPAFKPSVVYADPPYTRDHYSRFYHSLETIALGDDPNITKSNLGGGGIQSRGGYRAGRHQSPFCIKSEAPAAFSALFAGVAALRVPLVLSYSGYDQSMEARPRVMTLDAVTSLAKLHFKEVRVEQLVSLDHMKLNTTSLNKAAKGTTEVLLLCR